MNTVPPFTKFVIQVQDEEGTVLDTVGLSDLPTLIFGICEQDARQKNQNVGALEIQGAAIHRLGLLLSRIMEHCVPKENWLEVLQVLSDGAVLSFSPEDVATEEKKLKRMQDEQIRQAHGTTH